MENFHKTYWIGDNFLRFESVDRNHGNVADQQECHNLTTRLGAIMFGQVHAATCHVSDEQKLQNHLENSDRRGDGDKKVLVVWVLVGVQSTGNQAENGVQEETEG